MDFQISLSKFHKNSLSERLLEGKAITLRRINRTENTFSESFFTVLNLTYFLSQHSPQSAYKYHFAYSTSTVLAKGFLRGKLKLCETNSQITTKFLTLLLSHFDQRIFPLALFSSKGSEISVLRFHEISVENSSTKYSCNSASGSHTTKSSFSETFFLFFIEWYLFYPCSLPRDPKYQFSDSTEIRRANSSMKYSCNSVSGSHTSQSSISEIFFPVFIWGYCFFHHRPLWPSKYPLANSTRTVFADRFWRGKL